MADEGTSVHDVLPPYAPAGKRPGTTGAPQIGQLLCTIVPETHSQPRLMDALRTDSTRHDSVSGVIRAVDPSADYRPKPTRLPVQKLKLGECEELLVVKSKVRPCVVLATAQGIPDAHLPAAERGMARPSFQRPSYLVAPAYSASTPLEPHAMSVTIAARAACLVYPQLVYLPKSGGYIKNESVVRLDRAFWTTLPPPYELYALALSTERLAIVQGQLLVLQDLDPGEKYVRLVTLLRRALDPKFETPIP